MTRGDQDASSIQVFPLVPQEEMEAYRKILERCEAGLAATTSSNADATSSTTNPGHLGNAASSDAGEWDLVHAFIAKKLAPVVVDSAVDATGGAGGSRTRLAKRKAAQGVRVEKQLNKGSMRVVRDFIRVHPDDGTFRKSPKFWQIRRNAWETFLDYIRARANVSVDVNGWINIQKKDAYAATVVPSSTVSSGTPCVSGPSDPGPSFRDQSDAGPSSA